MDTGSTGPSVAPRVSCTVLLQLERHFEPRLDEKWKSQEKKAKREAKKAAEAGTQFVPQQDRPEATFVASLVDLFLEVRGLECPRLAESQALSAEETLP